MFEKLSGVPAVIMLCLSLAACGRDGAYIAMAMNVRKSAADIILNINNGNFSDVLFISDTRFEKIQGIAMTSDTICDMRTGHIRETAIRTAQADPGLLKLVSNNRIGSYAAQGASADFTGVLKLIIDRDTYDKLLAKCEGISAGAE